jgi:mannose-6-phosphate isomerase-like protein (cupin superfamily)
VVFLLLVPGRGCTTDHRGPEDSTLQPTKQILFCLVFVVIGGTLSWLISSELRRRRIPERVRLAFFAFIESGGDKVDGLPMKNLRKPVALKDIERTPCATGSDAVAAGHEDAGCQRILVSPATALTSALNVTVLDIPPGKELALREAQGAECYYVIQGDGVCVIGGNGSSNENSAVGAGDVLVIDPGR